jgi:hypothetical protein
VIDYFFKGDRMFENRKNSLLPKTAFITRLIRFSAAGAAISMLSLGIGMLGYHGFEKLPWIDAFANAAMILSGMGPLSPLSTGSGKLFAGCYALYSGLAFLIVVGLFIAPIFHRFLHQFHLEMDDDREKRNS